MITFAQRTKNIRKTWMLMAVFFGAVIGLGWVFANIYHNPGILYFAVVFSVFMNVLSYWFSDKIALALHRACPVDLKSNPELYKILEKVAKEAGLPLPRFYIIDDPAPNAFATGRNQKHAIVVATSGLLQRLDNKELEAVLAHEISHIGNRDMLVSTVAVVLVGFVSILSNIFMQSLWWGGLGRDREREGGSGLMLAIGVIFSILAPLIASLMQLAISRKRELLADASGAALEKSPDDLISALRKISAYPAPLKTASNATAHLFFGNPFGADKNGARKAPWLIKIFSTHPPIGERIRALEQMRI